MADTAVAPNNRAVVYGTRPQRERPRVPIATADRQINKLRKRGAVSDRAAAKHLGNYGGKDQEPIDASTR